MQKELSLVSDNIKKIHHETEDIDNYQPLFDLLIV